MRSLIIQNCNGVKAGEIYHSELSDLDKGHSQIYASSLYVFLNEKGENIAKPKDTDDKIVIGYTPYGMVFQIVTDGFFGCEHHAVFNFIDNYIVPLMESYSNELMTKDPTQVTSQLIKHIYALNNKHSHGAEFTLSIAMTYPKEGNIRCAGFGIGDTAIAIKRTNGEIQQLVTHSEVDGFKDAFDAYSSVNTDLVISRNTIFDIPVEIDDEIVGYTYLPPVLETLISEFATSHIKAKDTDESLTVKHFALNPTLFRRDGSLFTQLLDVVQIQQQTLITQAKNAGTSKRFGDDFTVGCIKIPNLALMNQLKLHIMSNWIMENLDSYISKHNKHTGFFKFFMGNPTLRAEIYKNLITHYKNHPLCLEIIFLVLLSNPKDEELFKLIDPDAKHAIRKEMIQNEWLAVYKLLDSDLQIRCEDQESFLFTADIKTIDQITPKVTTYINSKKDSTIDENLVQLLRRWESTKTTIPPITTTKIF